MTRKIDAVIFAPIVYLWEVIFVEKLADKSSEVVSYFVFALAEVEKDLGKAFFEIEAVFLDGSGVAFIGDSFINPEQQIKFGATGKVFLEKVSRIPILATTQIQRATMAKKYLENLKKLEEEKKLQEQKKSQQTQEQ